MLVTHFSSIFQYLRGFILLLSMCIPNLCGIYAQDVNEQAIAVLEIKNSAQLSPFEISILTNEVRGVASKLSGFMVMTKENIDVMLPEGVNVEDCVGKCEVETGRKLGAAFIVTGEVGRIEGQLQLSIRLFNTAEGDLLGQEVVSGSSVREMQSQLKEASNTLFSLLNQSVVSSNVESGSTVFLVLNPPNLRLKLNKTALSKGSLQAKKGGFLLRLKPGKYILRGSASGYLSQEEEFVLTQ